MPKISELPDNIAINSSDLIAIVQDNTTRQITLGELAQISNSQLELITQGINVGHRILGRLSQNFGEIGQGAIDLSISDTSTGIFGATGTGSLASGYQTTASGAYSFTQGFQTITTNFAQVSLGKNNVGLLDTILEVGIGETSKLNALEIYTDGRILAPQLTSIVDAKSLITKEYFDGNSSAASQLELVGVGWGLLGRTASNYIATGFKSVDLSYSDELDNGASSQHSFVVGKNNKVIHDFAVASGEKTISSNTHSWVTGRYNTGTLGNLVEVGAGDSIERKNAFEVTEAGGVTAPMLTVATINLVERSLVTKEYVDQMTINGGIYF